MAFTDQQGFFDFVRSINEKYLKPADANFKVLEEYCGKSGIPCVDSLKNAYTQLVMAIQLEDISSGKNKVDECLEKYIYELQKDLLKTYLKLIEVRRKDLLTNIPETCKTEVIKIIRSEKSKFKIILSTHKDNDKKSILDSLIQCSKEIYDFIEKMYKTYHLV